MPVSRRFFAIACLLAFAWIFSYAWVTEDAYITFRVVDNFVHGYGLRWNIDERVQVYTHPLWMLLQIPFYALFGHIFLVSIGLSLVFALGAVLLLVKSREADALPRAVLVLLPLSASASFCRYIICGLETPLLLCLLGWFLYEFLHSRRIYRLGLIAALCLLTRLDTVFALLPFALWLAVTQRKRWRALPLLKAFSPLLLWWGFCLFYYGFIFPNTAYAKLGAGIPRSDYILQGLRYVQNMLYFDTAGLAWILAALVMTTAGLLSRKRKTEPFTLLCGAGIALQVAYVIAIGGDFMAGRFFVVPLYLAVWLIYTAGFRWLARALAAIAVATAAIILIAFTVLPDNWRANTDIYNQYGIVDERSIYAHATALFPPGELWPRAELVSGWRYLGQIDLADPANINHVKVFDIDGMYGYFAGPELTIIDRCAITDPFLARLPVLDVHHWRIGHFERPLPPGYLYARQTGDDSQMSEPLRGYYEKLRLVTSGNLFDMARLKAIMGFQLGRYEAWRQAYRFAATAQMKEH